MGSEPKVGDIMQFKSLEEIIAEYGNYDANGMIHGIPGGFNTKMEYMCGQVFTIESIDHGRTTYYRSKEGIENERRDISGIRFWYISKEMLKPYEDASPSDDDVHEDDFLEVLFS